jgi:acetyl-CoA carboxylase biotin carboxyl carrier protein
MKTTDLAEFCYEKDGDYIEIKTAQALPEPAEFSCSLTAVTAPAVGIYHLAPKGQNLMLSAGQAVKEGDNLGWVETASKTYPVTAPTDGKLRVVTAEEGAAVEYGLPLFFIEK